MKTDGEAGPGAFRLAFLHHAGLATRHPNDEIDCMRPATGA